MCPSTPCVGGMLCTGGETVPHCLQIQISMQGLEIRFCYLLAADANSIERVKILSIYYIFKLQLFSNR